MRGFERTQSQAAKPNPRPSSTWDRSIEPAASGDAIALVAPNIIFSLAITQKDSLATMLQIGARYFEFRPAHLHRAVRPAGALPDRLYFQVARASLVYVQPLETHCVRDEESDDELSFI
ncbi:hypothetical protein C8A03DRAFT_38965 [Achaetomium macrosporum]|uniref:Uncharacterized protein n=1 Tax=Achaetomium macrosporum TaxID=79813 RepID=A0AAN7H6R7_9PEZI|nr:hypothetical protein C8A03DRAFT_38965 [Achaetomium macrosporum]